jgi:serine protease Do
MARRRTLHLSDFPSQPPTFSPRTAPAPQTRAPRSGGWMLVTLLLFGALISLGCSRASANPRGSESAEPAPATRLGAAEPLALARSEGSATDPIADVVELVLPSVVSVASRQPAQASPFHQFFGVPEQPREGLGSGVILSTDGLVVTNNHVVERAEALRVRTFDDREFDAKVVGTDPKSDLALLRLEGDLGELRPIVLGDSGKVRLGETVLAIGNPFGVGQTVTQGIVSAKGRADMGIVDYEDFIQTDAAINPGNSGGALVNARGELIGINTAILSRSGGSMGIGFAIPTNMALPIIEALRADGRVTRGWLGVGIQELTPELREAMKLGDSSGVLLTDVQPEGPAAKAGLRGGDVVTEVEGAPVDSTGRFRNLIAGAGAERRIALTVLRAGKKLRVEVLLGTLPGEPPERAEVSESPEKDSPAVDGLSLRALDAELRQRLRVPAEVEGVVVARVAPGSPAARARLRPGDVLLEVDRKPVRSPEEAQRLYAQGAGPRLLLVLRGGARSYVVVK